MAPFTVEGSCNRVVFEVWLETCLLPVLKPGQVVILDNATFHRGGRIAELIENVGIPQLIESKKTPMRDLAVAMIVSRIINPTSKLGKVRGIKAETA